MLKRLIIHMVVLTASFSTLLADDAYHTYIRSQLAEQYGVYGGQWILPDSERHTTTALEADNVTIEVKPSSGIESFNQILYVDVPLRRINSWDAILRFPTTVPLHKSDVVLFIFWINNNDSLNRRQNVIFDFEMPNFPDDRPLYLAHQIKSGWQQWYVPIQVNHDCSAGAAKFQIHLGHMQGHFQLAGVAALNFKNQYPPEKLPRSIYHLEYEGQDNDAAWRHVALERIETIRKSPLTIKIVNKHREPIEGAHIQVDMLRHEFGFGSAISSDLFFQDTHDARIYRQKLENLTGDGRSFNVVTLKNALKWPAWEDDDAWGSREQAVQVIRWFSERGVRVRGHNLLWPDWQKMPDDLKIHAVNRLYLTTRIRDHIVDEVAFPGLKGFISEWDVLNEVQHHDDLVQALGSDDIYAACFEWAAAADPQARLYVNENNILPGSQSAFTMPPLLAFLQKLRDAGAPLHGLGLQGHMTENLTPPDTLLFVFDRFYDLDLDLSITEYDAVNVDERLAADYMRDILIAAFSHPRMKNFVMWGFWDGAHWKQDAPVFRQDWSLKPSGRVFLDYVYDKWWTNARGVTDHLGSLSTSGFFGDYAIAVSLNNSESRYTIRLSGDQTEFVLVVDTDQTTALSPDSFALEQNTPNPFNTLSTMMYTLPMDMPIKIDLYDVRGRCINTLVNQPQNAGRHMVSIDGADLASGIYYVQLQSGTLKQVRKIVLIK